MSEQGGSPNMKRKIVSIFNHRIAPHIYIFIVHSAGCRLAQIVPTH